jgi:hypothetical protein
MATAVKITFGATTVEFADYEVLDAKVFDGRNSVIKRNHNGDHSDIRRSGYGAVRIKFNLQSSGSAATSTLSKLKQLEEADDDEFYVYPKYISDAAIVRRCVLLRGQIAEELAVAGHNAGRRELEVEFLEVTK